MNLLLEINNKLFKTVSSISLLIALNVPDEVKTAKNCLSMFK